MRYRILADALVVIHFLWILFMLIGFFMTLWAVIGRRLFRRCRRFLDRWVFRTVHLCGILFVVAVAALGRYCPLTIWEYQLRLRYDPDLIYPGDFIARYVERLVYPSVPPWAIFIPTVFVGVFTLAAFVLFPPAKIKCWFQIRQDRRKGF